MAALVAMGCLGLLAACSGSKDISSCNAALNGKRYDEALKCLEPLAQKGNAEAQDDIGRIYEAGLGVPQDFKQAAGWYRKAADQGYARAQNSLGLLYMNGQGVTQDYQQAIDWFRKAAAQGEAEAQNNLGFMYANGFGVPKDLNQAIALFRKAAAQGVVPAKQALKQLGFSEHGSP